LKGYVVNKFRGDISLFHSAHDILFEHTKLENFGTLPWFAQARALPAEDAVALESMNSLGNTKSGKRIKIAVPRLSRIANFDDLDPLQAEEDVDVILVQSGEAIPGDADLVILPGSKTTMPDLQVLCAEGWDVDIHAHLRRGGHVLGICAGFQMLGNTLADPDGIEGNAGSVDGLGLLDIVTSMSGEKRLVEISGTELSCNETISGYEMHMGRTEGAGLDKPMLNLGGNRDGAISADGRVMGCYLHGLFSNDTFRQACLARFKAGRESGVAYENKVEETLDLLAAHCEEYLDVEAMIRLARAGA